MLPISILIIAKNEEQNIARCLDALPQAKEVVLIDAESEDSTRSIATARGVRVLVRAFDDYASQRNAAISEASCDWVLFVDADEVCSSSLGEEIKSFFELGLDKDYTGIRIRRRLVFNGKCLRFGSSADAPLRMFKQHVYFYKGVIHELPHRKSSDAKEKIFTTAKTGFYHYSYKNMDDYIAKLNRYTSLPASQKSRSPSLVNLYLRFWFEFLSRYVFRLGFLDGKSGYIYALCSSFYAFMKYVKADEMQ